MSIGLICRDWDFPDIVNLGSIVGLSEQDVSIDAIEKKIKWLYHSKSRAKGKNIYKKIKKLLINSDINITIDGQYENPAYEEILDGLLSRYRITLKGESVSEKETFLSQMVIADAIYNMSPEQRRTAFSAEVDLNTIVESSSSIDESISVGTRSLAVLGLANVAGFSLYTSSTMALSFLSGAIGVTFPFAVYTGMSSFISIIVGPLGWITAGGFTFWKLTSPDWERLKCAVLYIITVRSRN